MMRVLACLAAAVLLLSATAAEAAGGFANWAAIVVAGDFHAHSGAPSEVFDNARHDVAGALVGIGFSPQNVLQFSVRPERYPGDAPHASTPKEIADGLWDLSNRADGGCLAYFTSHGSPDGIVLGDQLLSPRQMAGIIDNACGGRPSVVIVSACFSGVFVPALQAPERIVLTAAAHDRTSFGCGEADRYNFFDTCALQWLLPAGNFPDFAKDVIACIRTREKKERMKPPSRPQLAVGAAADAIPHWP
jgi:hypothetical protein